MLRSLVGSEMCIRDSIPLMLVDTMSIQDGQAAQYASVFTGGMAAGVFFGGILYDYLDPAHKSLLVVGCAALTSMSFGLIGLMVAQAQLTILPCLAALFVAGASVGVPYYIPSSVFGLEFGGEYAGSVISTIDAVGYGCTILFQGSSDWIRASSGWTGLIGVMFGICLLGTIAIGTFEWLEAQAMARPMSSVNVAVEADEQIMLCKPATSPMPIRPAIGYEHDTSLKPGNSTSTTMSNAAQNCLQYYQNLADDTPALSVARPESRGHHSPMGPPSGLSSVVNITMS
eukprot:TRINITY_DN18817_c0_g1_i2.p1 TRINITY_DN18817_c0_g1~~TRINITY_DN18817_c0_g1_i2.p1  ORF type:complete len:286 (+),score=57.66 TRINITY_DN18817_c0_g1_i2:158-1015(+)